MTFLPLYSQPLPCFYYPATDLPWEICLAYPSLGWPSSALFFLNPPGFLFPVSLLLCLAIPTKLCFSLHSFPSSTLSCRAYVSGFVLPFIPIPHLYLPTSSLPPLALPCLLLLTLISLPVSQLLCLAQPPLVFPALPTHSLAFLSLPTPSCPCLPHQGSNSATNPVTVFWHLFTGSIYFGGENPISFEMGS